MSAIRNLGPVSMQWLAAIGIHTADDLRRVGALDAYRLLTLRGYRVSLNLLWAMEAGLRGIHWLELPVEVRDRLRAELSAPWDAARVMEL